MTLKELKQAIAESSNQEFYQNYQLTVNYPNINFNVPFKGIAAIYEFILNQIRGFDELGELPAELQSIKKSLIISRDQIINLVRNNSSDISQWNNDLTRITDTSTIKLLYNSPETEFLIRIKREKPDHFEGVYQYLSGNTNNSNSRNHLIGYFLAYEFTSKDFSEITERKAAEKKSIASIRADFQRQLNESDSQLIEYLTKAKENSEGNSAAIEDFRKEKEEEFYKWYDKAVKEVEMFNGESTQKMKDFEELYKEKLKLEAPAKYWSDRAKKLRKEGNRWLTALILCIVLAIGILIWVLDKTEDGTLQQIFHETSTAVKWSVTLITLISFLAYGIRIFSKLTFSSFHLVRDAEEKEQLTYVYLALQKEKSIDQTERHLIMQSLFSRADSGLLKDDSGPTMPGNIADKIMTR